MTFCAHISGKAPMKRRRLPAYTIPWNCACQFNVVNGEHAGQSLPPVRVTRGRIAFKTNPGYLTKCVDCGTSREDAAA